ncbi:MAG: monovalent cation/H(+) antiporter subunit G [Planctomycetota bacterium]
METLGWIFLIVGGLFDLFGCIGLARLPDIYNRLQAATKCVTLGTCLILAGAACLAEGSELAGKALLCALVILLTAPVGAHALARAAYRSGIPVWKKPDESLPEEVEE